MSWRQRAACRCYDPELFFPNGVSAQAKQQTESAKAVCASCPVRRPCLAWTRRYRPEYGVWAGLSETERRCARMPSLGGPRPCLGTTDLMTRAPDDRGLDTLRAHRVSVRDVSEQRPDPLDGFDDQRRVERDRAIGRDADVADRLADALTRRDPPERA